MPRPIAIHFIISIFFAYVCIFPYQISAAELEISEPIRSSSAVEVPTAVQISKEDLTIHGYGEPDAEITLTARKSGEVIFSRTTRVNPEGKWQMDVPGFVEDFPDQVLLSSSSEVSYLDIAESTAVTATAATAGVVALQMIIEQVIRLFQVLGLFGKKTSRGLVYDVETKRPVSFALITIERKSEKSTDHTVLRETVVSNENGFLRTVDLPRGSYTLAVAHPEYAFPISGKKPWYTSPLDFYQGEVIELSKQDQLDVLFVPLQPLSKLAKKSPLHWLNARVLVSLIRRGLQVLSIPLGVLSCVLTLFYPSFINFSLASFYIVIGAYHLFKYTQKPVLSGRVVNEDGTPVSDATVRVIRTPPEELAAVIFTNTHGTFQTRLKKGHYRVMVGKEGLTADNNAKTFTEIELTKNHQNVEYKMKKPADFDWNAVS